MSVSMVVCVFVLVSMFVCVAVFSSMSVSVSASVNNIRPVHKGPRGTFKFYSLHLS